MDRDRTGLSEVEAYIGGFPADVQARLQAVREVIRAAAPEATEKMSYGIPTFTLGENLVHFAAFSRHIGLYPGPSGIIAFSDELSGYKRAKGSVQFPLDRPLPLELIGRIVTFRVGDIKARQVRRT